VKTDIRSSEAFRQLFLVPPDESPEVLGTADSEQEQDESQHLKTLEKWYPDTSQPAVTQPSAAMKVFLVSCTALVWVAIITTTLVVLFFVGIVTTAIAHGL